MNKTFSALKLWRQQERLVNGGVRSSLEGVRNAHRVLTLIRRPVGRTFYGAGRDLDYDDDQFYPQGTGPDAIGVSEEWFGRTAPAVTGNKNLEDGGKPFLFEGVAHVLDADGDLAGLQELIEEDPEFMIGPQTEALSRQLYGKPSLTIYDKYFNADRTLMCHRHNRKWECYHIDPIGNERVASPGYLTTAAGYHQWVTPEMLLAALQKFGQGNYLEIARLQPHIPMFVGCGFLMPAGVDHAPAKYRTQEPQFNYDEHTLVVDSCGDREITWDVAWSATMEDDYPKAERTWEQVVSKTDWDLVRDPSFIAKHQCRPLLDIQRTADGDGSVHWVIYGLMQGKQQASTQRIVIPPKGKHILRHPSWSICHMLQGQGRIGGTLDIKLERKAKLGQTTRDRWFTPYASARDPQGILVENTGTDDLIFKCTFGQDAFPALEFPKIVL